MKYVVDIDGVVCANTVDCNYRNAEPFKDNIDLLNKIAENNYMVYYTARGSETGIDWVEITKDQLKRWGVVYHQLMFGKPSADYYIDDKLITMDQLKYYYEDGDEYGG